MQYSRKHFLNTFISCLFCTHIKELGIFGSWSSPVYILTAFHEGNFQRFIILILGGFSVSISFVFFFWHIGSVQTVDKIRLIKKSD